VDKVMNAASVNPVKPNPIAPSAWEYAWPALWLLFGFIWAWGAVRVIGWVGAGFVQPPKYEPAYGCRSLFGFSL
jgi:hypothetical protein